MIRVPRGERTADIGMSGFAVSPMGQLCDCPCCIDLFVCLFVCSQHLESACKMFGVDVIGLDGFALLVEFEPPRKSQEQCEALIWETKCNPSMSGYWLNINPRSRHIVKLYLRTEDLSPVCMTELLVEEWKGDCVHQQIAIPRMILTQFSNFGPQKCLQS